MLSLRAVLTYYVENMDSARLMASNIIVNRLFTAGHEQRKTKTQISLITLEYQSGK